jgi:hypothetical protein
MCSPTDHVVEGILKYSLIPYAEQNNIDIRDLIKKLSDYHSSIAKENPKEITEPSKRGRPVGSKNIYKAENTIVIKAKRPRGRPKGSTKKKYNQLIFEED